MRTSEDVIFCYISSFSGTSFRSCKRKGGIMSTIAAFYGGKSILITGATGFLGKVLMEKLFRTSPDLKVIYILVRPKAGQTLQQRVFQILDSKVCLIGKRV